MQQAHERRRIRAVATAEGRTQDEARRRGVGDRAVGCCAARRAHAEEFIIIIVIAEGGDERRRRGDDDGGGGGWHVIRGGGGGDLLLVPVVVVPPSMRIRLSCFRRAAAHHHRGGGAVREPKCGMDDGTDGPEEKRKGARQREERLPIDGMTRNGSAGDDRSAASSSSSSSSEAAASPTPRSAAEGGAAPAAPPPPPAASGRSIVASSPDAWQAVETCAICLEPYGENDRVSYSRRRNCAHAFHAACILAWLRDEFRNDCPICRGPYLHLCVVEDDGDDYLGGEVAIPPMGALAEGVPGRC